MKIACHKSGDNACRVCEYRYVCDLSAYHKHNDVPAQNPLQVDSVLDPTSDNPIANRAVALAIEALHLTIGRWGSISGNIDEQGDLSARFGSINEIIGQLQEVVDVLKTHAVMERGSGDKSVQLVDDLRTDGKGATGKRSAAFGRNTLASGENAFAEGRETTASNSDSHAEGKRTIAGGGSSHAEGEGTRTGNTAAHAEGNSTRATGSASHAEGHRTETSGYASHAEGNSTSASGSKAHAEGNGTIAEGDQSHAEGYYSKATGSNSHAEGSSVVASGSTSHAEGYSTEASGDNSHAEGSNTSASGVDSHAEGNNTSAEGDWSHAGGTAGTTSKGKASFAHGSGCRANTEYSVAVGLSCGAGDYEKTPDPDNPGEDKNRGSVAMGIGNYSRHKASAVFGGDNNSSRDYQAVVGHDNADDSHALFIVGNGNSRDNRSNAFAVRENGDAVAAGDVISGNVNITNILNTLSPKIPANFGSIVCLTLGQTIGAGDLQKIMPVLHRIMESKKHHIITIYDTVENKFFGDCEVVQEDSNSFGIITNYVSTTLTAYTIYYSFNKTTGNYTRNKYSVSIASKGSVEKLQKDVENINLRLNDIEQRLACIEQKDNNNYANMIGEL